MNQNVFFSYVSIIRGFIEHEQLTNWNTQKIGLQLKQQLVSTHATRDLKHFQIYPAVFVHRLDNLEILKRHRLESRSYDVSFRRVLSDANYQPGQIIVPKLNANWLRETMS